MPTIVFDPVAGPWTLKADGGHRLNSPPLFLLFWGSYWVTDVGGREARTIIDAAQKLVAGPYFSGLKEYRTDGNVTWGNFDTVIEGNIKNSQFIHDPAPNFSSDDLYQLIKNEVDDNVTSNIPRPTTPAHVPMYMVLTPPGITSDQPGATGYHTARSRVRFDVGDGFQHDLFYFGWVSTNHTLDDATRRLSHEMAETITDPTAGGLDTDFPFEGVPNGIHFNRPGHDVNAIDDEICDGEAQNYAYRVNGVWVQSYWSNLRADFHIADGNQQNFEVETLPDNSRRLYVLGDQRGNGDDKIRVNMPGNIGVDLNNESVTFEPSHNIGSVLVISGYGRDTIDVDFVIATTLDINSSGNATVNIQYGAVTNRVTISSPLSNTNLHVLAPLFSDDPLILDSFDNGRYGRIRGFIDRPPLEYLYAGMDSVTIEGGNADILATGVPTQFTSAATADRRALITVGEASNVQGIKGPLTISGGRNGFDLIVDDSVDTVDRVISMDKISIDGADYGRIAFAGGVAPINYKYASTHTLTIYTGTGSTTINVAVTGTTTKIRPYAGDTHVNLGGSDGTVADILFPLTVTNPVRSTILTVNDFNDAVLRNVTLDTVAIDDERYGRINIPGSAPVYYKDGETARVNVHTGSGGARVNVLTTLTTTWVYTHGLDTTVTAGDAGHIQRNFEADLFITGPTLVNVDASNDPGNLGAFVDRVDRADGIYGRIYNLAAGAIYYRYSDTRALAIHTGTGDGPNPALLIVEATGVPTTLTGHGPTLVNVGRGNMQQIKGEVTINNVAARTAVTVDDRDDPINRDVGLQPVDINGVSYGRVRLLYDIANINYKYTDTDSVTVHTGKGGATIAVYATGAQTSVIGHGPNTKVYVGIITSQLRDIAAPLTIGSEAGSVQIDVDDYRDGQQRQTTYDTVLVNGTPYGRISGLAPADIRYQYLGTDSVTVTAGYFGGTANVLATGARLILSNTFDETVNVGNNGSVQDIRGELRVAYATNVGVLNIDDSADTAARTVTYEVSYANDDTYGLQRITGLAPATILHRASQSASVRLGSGGGTFNLLSSFAATLSVTDNGDTLFNIGDGGKLSRVSKVEVTAATGITRLVVDNSASPGGGPVAILRANDLQATLLVDTTTIVFSGNAVSEMTVNLQSFTGLTIENTTAFKTTINTGGNGNLYVKNFSPNTQVVVNAGRAAGTNYLFGPDLPDTWHITGANSGDLGNGVIQFTNFPYVYGGRADDTFYFMDGGSVAALYGVGGTNTLDYSNWSGDVLFNPNFYQATGTGVIEDFQNATGGKGSSILIGAHGANSVLRGGIGRNLLIAGGGVPATLIGNSGESILIGGSTEYNGNLAALQAIMTEWARTDEDYATRVDNLLNGKGVPRLDPTTVHYNYGGNTLQGGSARDFFFGRKATDQNNWDPNTESFVEL